MGTVADTHNLVLSADRLANFLLAPVYAGKTSHRDMMMVATMAFQLLKATYPDPGELFQVIQEAEATLELFAGPSGEC